MTDILLEQFSRLLAVLPTDDPWPTLLDSGFLDLLREESEGGAELALEDLYPLALEIGGLKARPCILETMVARLVDNKALNTADLESLLSGHPAARAIAAIVAAALMVGAMIQIQTMTIEYAKTRRQFGREIGSFQAVQQQLAVLAEEVLAARIAVQAAFVGKPLEVSERRAAIAKIRAGEAGTAVAAISHAVHGAIGVSAEHPLPHYTRALRQGAATHGGEAWWSRRLGEWVTAEDQDLVSLARSLTRS